jgi:hypothetical protein
VSSDQSRPVSSAQEQAVAVVVEEVVVVADGVPAVVGAIWSPPAAISDAVWEAETEVETEAEMEVVAHEASASER